MSGFRRGADRMVSPGWRVLYVFMEEVYELLRVAEKTVHRAAEDMKIRASDLPLAKGARL